MESPMQVSEVCLQVSSIVFPRHPVHSRRRLLLEAVVAHPKQIDRHVVEERGEPRLPVLSCCLAHAIQPAVPAFLARCPAFVRLLRRSYAVVRLPVVVHMSLMAHRLHSSACRVPATGDQRGLSVLAHGVSMHAWVLATPPGRDALASIAAPPCSLPVRAKPSAPGLPISKLSAPACICTCQRFKCALAGRPRMTRIQDGWLILSWRLLHSQLHVGLSRRYLPVRRCPRASRPEKASTHAFFSARSCGGTP